MRAFSPLPASTKNVDVSSSNQRVKIGLGTGFTDVQVWNDGSATAWIEFGGPGVAATTAAGVPIGAGVGMVLSARNPDGGGLYAAAIAAGSTGRIYFTPGGGI